MKVIQSRIYIEKANEGNIIQDRTSLLAWFLSVMKWKELGYEPVLYTDEITKAEFDKLGLSQLYDEVNIIDINSNVNTDVFWASSKIFSIRQFMNKYPNEEFVISDLDFIPLKDPKGFVFEKSIVTFYTDYKEMYADINELNFNKNYKLPDFFTGNVDPINTCLLYIPKDLIGIFENYLTMEEEFINYNYNFESGEMSNDLMAFVEQRLFTEYLVSNNININFMNPVDKSVFNTSGLHTGPYKSIEKTEYWKWIIWYFKIIKESNKDIYNSIISLDLYKDIKDIIDNGGGEYTNKKDKVIKIENFDWNTLEYPRAFEDIYDPVWNS